MLTFELMIRPAVASSEPVAGWFVPGSHAQIWLDVITQWDLDHSQLKIFVVPTSRTERSPIGLLVFGNSLQHALTRLHRTNAMIPFVCRAEQLFLPANAELFPEMSNEEIAHLMVEGNVYVWHPTTGLVVAAADEILRISDLLTCHGRLDTDWDRAHPGVRFNDRLHRIEAEMPQDPDEVLADGRDDIGDSTKDLKKIPQSSDRPGVSRRSAGSGLMNALAKFIFWAANKAPSTANKRTWIDGVEDWASRKLASRAQDLFAWRHKELFRLIDMLKHDPDRGLRFALPLNSNSMHRGVAPPGARLGDRNVDFRLSSLGGGQAADFWDIPHELRLQLTARYRALAEREIQLGRFRRAAYIYAELLGDLHAAARTLEAGKHYREAAVVYRKKLNRNEDACHCLEAGGLFGEAIELREGLGQFEKAGDLYARLQLHDQAANAFQKAADISREKDDRLDAARIEETKLNDSHRALATLAQGWPKSSQAIACVSETFRILSQLGEHQQTHDWIEKIRLQSQAENVPPGIAELLSSTALQYPDRTTKELARDATYHVVSNAIRHEPAQNTFNLLDCVARLSPDDNLLSRDCQRYRQEAKTKSIIPTRTRHPFDTGKLKCMQTLKLPADVVWKNALGIGNHYFAIGIRNRTFFHVRAASNGTTEVAELGIVEKTWRNPKFLMAASHDCRTIAVQAIGDQSCAKVRMRADDNVPFVTDVGNVPGLDKKTFGLSQMLHNQWLLTRWVKQTLVLETVNEQGTILNSRLLKDRSELSSLTIPIPMACHFSRTYVGVGPQVLVIRGDQIAAIDFDEPVRNLAVGARETFARVAIGFDFGVCLLGSENELTTGVKLCPDLENPHLLFTRSGHLIIASNTQCEVYSTIRNQPKHVCSAEIQECVGLLRAADSQHFSVLTKTGEIVCYKFPLE
jgi:tetratricopeptide (TPR) repeat protein